MAEVKVNSVVYAHSDASMQIIPREGVNQGIPFEVRKLKSLGWDPGAGSAQLEGNSVGPEGIAPTSAKPTWDAELSSVTESMAIAAHLGEGAVSVLCDVVITWRRKGKPTTVIDVEQTYITKGFGGKSDAGSAPSGTLGGNCVDIFQKIGNGKRISLLNKAA